jgi:hypothetical protein
MVKDAKKNYTFGATNYWKYEKIMNSQGYIEEYYD